MRIVVILFLRERVRTAGTLLGIGTNGGCFADGSDHRDSVKAG
jgi:hypothetical protein